MTSSSAKIALPDTDASPSGGMTRWRVLVGAIIVQLILGTVYGYSIFWQPLEAELGLAQHHANYAFAICVLSFAVTMVLAGRIQDLMGPRVPAIIGAVLMGGGFLLAGLVNHAIIFYLAHAAFVGGLVIVLLMAQHAVLGHLDPKTVPIVRYVPHGIVAAAIVAGVVLANEYVGKSDEVDRLFLLWGTVGFLAGAGIGFAYVCPIAALVKWFPAQKGLMAGIAVAGFGLGAYVFSHKSFPFSAENYIERWGIVNLFVVHGLVSLVGISIGAMMLRNPPGVAGGASAGGESTWQRTLREPAFWLLWLMYFSGALAGLMVIGILKPFAGEQLVAAAGEVTQMQRADLLARGVTAVGWLAIFNAVGRIVWGMVSDRIGRTPTFVAMFIFQALVMFFLGGLNTEVSLAVGASLVGFNYGGCFALFPSATADLFGPKNLGANYGWLFTSYGIAGVVGIYAPNTAMEQTGSYFGAFVLAGVLCLISAGLAVLLHRLRRRQAISVAS